MEPRTIVDNAVKEFEGVPTLTLAKKLYKEHPKAFVSVDALRQMIQYRRGNKGKGHRQTAEKKYGETFRKNGKPGWTVPKSKAKPPRNFRLCNGKWLILSDIHIPYHDDEALELALSYGESVGIEHVLLNGDICDFYGVSRWVTDPEERDLAGELTMTRQFLGHLRGRFPGARIVYKVGNHEERWENYMRLKAPELIGVQTFELSELLDFSRFGVELVAGKQKIKAGKHLTIIHGHEIFGGSSVNPARGLYNQVGVCAMMGHRHQSSSHAQKNADDKFTACWSIGCLCDMSPEYAIINKWNHGFAILDLDGSDFNVNNLRIVNGKINHL